MSPCETLDWANLVARCAAIAAPGTDPALLAHLVAWTVRPRRSLDALRRRCRDEGLVEVPDATTGRVLARLTASYLTMDDVRAATQVVHLWNERACAISIIGDPTYPALLAEGWPQTDAPCLLVRRGQPLIERPTVAMVGARRASAYGTGVTSWLAQAAADAGARVVSGGALGIDAAAHRAAASRLGGTAVVLGCGHAVDYPRPHARPGGLFDEVMEHAGALLGELLPSEPPRAGMVRARNRIVAGLADVVVVVEGSSTSGALLTAGAAAERGRPVLAVPGDIRAPGSAAPHRLLQEGAAPCTDPTDLIDALQISPRHDSHGGTAGGSTLPVGSPGPDRRADNAGTADTASGATPSSVVSPTRLSALGGELYEVLARAWPRPVHIDDLAAVSGRPTGEILATLTRAQLAGELAQDATGIRLRRAPSSLRGDP